MPDLEPEEISDRLRADNVAPDQSETFFAMLAATAAASGTTASPRLGTRRTAVARLGAVVLGATLVVSGGAMASAILLNDTSGDRGPGRMPVEPSTVIDVRPSPSSDPSVPAPGELSDEATTPGQRATRPDADMGGQQSGAARGHGAAQGQPAEVPPGQSGGHLPRGNGQSQQHQPNANANPNSNGQGRGNSGSQGPAAGNSHAPNPKGNAIGHSGSQSAKERPKHHANNQQKLPGQGSPPVQG